MTDQEALRRWLRTAWEKGQQMIDLSICVQGGMSLREAEREMVAPLPSPYSPALPLSPHLGNLAVAVRSG